MLLSRSLYTSGLFSGPVSPAVHPPHGFPRSRRGGAAPGTLASKVPSPLPGIPHLTQQLDPAHPSGLTSVLKLVCSLSLFLLPQAVLPAHSPSPSFLVSGIIFPWGKISLFPLSDHRAGMGLIPPFDSRLSTRPGQSQSLLVTLE